MRSASPDSTRFRRHLRAGQTEAEQRLRYRLRDRRLAGVKFVRQETVGRYVSDFRCREARLIVELDGGQHADSSHDRVRDAWLTERGYRILRFWNAQVMNNTLGVPDTILAALSPSPRPRGEGRDDLRSRVFPRSVPECPSRAGSTWVVGAASPKGEGEGAAPEETLPEPPPHPRLPPRCDDDKVVASLSPQAGRGEIPV